MWIIVNVDPNMMHIFPFFYFLMFGFALFISFILGGGGVLYLETATIPIEIYFCY